MVIREVNGKKHAETNREEKLRFLSAMRTVIEFIVDIESAEKDRFLPFVQFQKHCPSADEIERLKPLPPDDYPDGFNFNFEASLLWFCEIMQLFAEKNRKDFLGRILKKLS